MGTDVAGHLRALSETALRATDIEEIVDAFLAAARGLIDVDQIHLIEVSQDAAVGHGRVVAYEAGGMREDAYVMVMDERPSGVTTSVRTREILHVPDAQNSPVLRTDYSKRFGVHCALFVPLMWDGEVRWVTVLARGKPDPFTDDAIDLARVIANQAAAGLALLEAGSRQESRADRDAALARAAAALNVDQPLAETLSVLTAEANVAVGGDMSGLYLVGAGGGVATAGHNTPPDWDGYVMKPGEGVGGQVLSTGRAAISNAYQNDVQLPESPGLQQLQTAVAVPVTIAGELRAALSIGFERMRRVTPADLRTLEAFADLAAVALRDAEPAG